MSERYLKNYDSRHERSDRSTPSEDRLDDAKAVASHTASDLARFTDSLGANLDQ
jgi:hypothetical protein